MPKVAKAPADKTPKKAVKAPETLRGFRDILPDEQPLWDRAERIAGSLARAYGFGRIRLPLVEQTSLFERSIGKDTDIVEKEMFTFVDQGGTKMTLRPEGTASVARAYVEHGMVNQSQPVKLWYFEPMFRHERPQAGRYRQFWQLGFEAIGSNDPIVDAQIVLMSERFCKDMGVDATVRINSLGTPAERKAYLVELVKYFKSVKKKLSEVDQKRLLRNPLRVLDSKEPGMDEVRAEAPQLLEHIGEESKQHFMRVLEYLDDAGVTYVLDPYLVRGLDYYAKTVFELVLSQPGSEEHAQSALGGGGRYDGLIPMFGGREETGAVGAAIGVERVLNAVRASGAPTSDVRNIDVFFCQLGEAARRKGLRMYEKFRAEGVEVAEAFSKGNLKGQLEIADKIKAPFAVILGQKEVLDGTVIVRDMDSGVQEIVDGEKVVAFVAKRLADMKQMDK